MAEVASAYVSILPSAKGFGRSLDSQTRGDLAAAGKRAGTTWGKVFKITAALAIGTKAISFFGDSLAEAREAEKVGARTKNVIEEMGHAAGISAKGVSDLAGAISLKTGIDDEAIQAGENLLLTFGNIRNEAGKGNDIFNQTTGLMVDLSTAMGSDAKGAAVQLGKALNDPVKGLTALSRVGVSFSEDQKKQIEGFVKAGDTMKAQKVILGELKRQFGGAAEAMASPADKAKVAFDNLKEQIGTALLPQVDRFLTFITDTVIPGLSDFAHDVKRFFKQAKEPVKNFLDSVTGSDAFVAVVDGIADAAGRLKRGFKGAKDALDGMDFSKLDSKQVGEFLGKALAKGLDKFLSLAGTVTKTIGQMFAKVDWVGLGIELGKQVPALLVGLAAGFLTFDIGGLFKQMADHWQVILGAVLIIAFAPAKFAGVLGKILSKIPFVGTFLARSVTWLNELGGKLASFGGELLKSMWKGLTAGRTPGAAIVAKVMSGFKGIPGAVKGFFDTLRIRLGVYALEGAEAFGRGIRNGFLAVVRFTASIPTKILTAIGNIARLLFPKSSAMIEGFLAGAREKFTTVVSFVKGIPGKIRSGLGNVGSLLVSAGADIVRGLINGIKSMAAAAASAAVGVVKDALNAAKNFLKIGSPSKKFHEVGVWSMLGLAEGMTEGGKKANEALKKQLDGLVSQLDNLKSKFSSIADTVASAFTGDLFSATATEAVAEVKDEAGNIVTAAVPAKSASQNFIENLMGTSNNLQALTAAFKKLTKLGFNKQFLAQLFQSGNGALILDLAATSNEQQATDVNTLFGGIESMSSQLGSDVASSVLGDRMTDVRNEIRELRKDIKQSGKEHTEGFAAAINGAVTRAVRDSPLRVRIV